MEIRGVTGKGRNYTFKKDGKPGTINMPGDSFVKSGGRGEDIDLKRMSELALGGKLSQKVKSCICHEIAKSASGKKVIRLDIKMDPGKQGGKFTGNIIPADNGKFYAVRLREMKNSVNSGNPSHEYSLVKMDESGDIAWESPLFSRNGFTAVTLKGTEDGKVAASYGDKISLFSADGARKWECDKHFSFEPDIEFSADGTVFVLDIYNHKDKIFKAIAPDGSEKWRREIKYGRMTTDEMGNLCIGDLEARYQIYQPDGTPGQHVDISDERLVSRSIPLGSDGVAFVTESPARYNYDRIVIHKGGKEQSFWEPDKDETIYDVAFDKKSKSFYVLTSARKEMNDRLYAMGIGGETKWKMDLPSKSDSAAKHLVQAGKDGNVYLVLKSLEDNPHIPDSYRSNFPSADDNAFNIKGTRTMIDCISPDGKIIWQNKMKRSLDSKAKCHATPDGNFMITDIADNRVSIISENAEKYETLSKKKMRDAIKEVEKSDSSGSAAKRNKIEIDKDGKHITIGGVELPISHPKDEM
ncbi:MAG: hypothetical protein K8T10_05765 [Candidatus Eremiobacteraeota bacterium]|nr:hypothetical protein [Candidatus Eremiobacteraeota bacterium]